MNYIKYLVIASLFLAFGCNSNKQIKETTEFVKSGVSFDSNKLDTITSDIKISFTGEIQISRFGEPGEVYSKQEKLPNKALILILKNHKNFYYRNEMDSLNFLFFKDYSQFQLNADSNIYADLERLNGKNVNLEGSVFQGLTKSYIRDLAIDVKKIYTKIKL